MNLKVVQPSGTLAESYKTIQPFREEINTLVETGVEMILVDFQNVTFIDSSGLGALVAAAKAVRAQKHKIFICSLNEQIKMLFELASMDQVFEIFPSQDHFYDAVMSMKKS